jgi:hypothetical protein
VGRWLDWRQRPDFGGGSRWTMQLRGPHEPVAACRGPAPGLRRCPVAGTVPGMGRKL